MSILRVANLQFNASGTRRIDYDAVADDGIIKVTAGAVKLPVGDSASRPAIQSGLVRYNSDTGYVEFGDDNNWVVVASNTAFDVANAAFASANNVGPQIAPAFNAANNALANTSGVSFNGNLVFPNGNIGIGITPSFKLDIYDATNSYFRMRGDTNVVQQLYRYSTDASSAQINLFKLRGTLSAASSVTTNDITGRLVFYGYDGSGNYQTAEIRSAVDGAVSTTIMPGRLSFYTNSGSGSGSATERMRIDSNGYVTLTNQPKFWIGGSPGITATITPQKFPWNGPANYDSANGFSDANDRYTAPVTGYYYIYTKLNIQASTQTTYMMIYKNGSQYSNGWVTNNQRQDYWVSHIIPLNASDYVEIWVSTVAGTTGFDNSGYFGGYLLG